MEMTEELQSLIDSLLAGAIIGLIVSIPIVIWRKIKHDRFFPEKKPFKSAKVFFLGIAVFGFMAIMSFIFVGPYFGSTFTLLALLYLLGLIFYKRGQRADLHNEHMQTRKDH